MVQIISAIAVLLGAIGAFLPYVVTFFPRAGVLLVYRLKALLWAILAAVLAVALAAYIINPTTGQVLVLIISALLAGMGILFSPQHIFVALEKPPRVAASQAQIEDDAIVLGLQLEDETLAWPYFDMIAPHHLINDKSGDRSLLVAY